MIVEAAARPHVAAEAERIGFDDRFLERPLNVDLSGGEKKRNETLQLGVLRAHDRDPRRARLRPRRRRVCAPAPPHRGRDTDETASACSPSPTTAGCCTSCPADRVHILVKGRIVRSGDASLAAELEAEGYAPYLD